MIMLKRPFQLHLRLRAPDDHHALSRADPRGAQGGRLPPRGVPRTPGVWWSQLSARRGGSLDAGSAS